MLIKVKILRKKLGTKLSKQQIQLKIKRKKHMIKLKTFSKGGYIGSVIGREESMVLKRRNN